jgi:Spy/CpxP family protein refolding chaperone
MKKLTLAIFVVLAASLAVAQGPGGRPGGPGGMGGRGGPGGAGGRGRMDPKAFTEMLAKSLKLTEGQKKQILAMQTARQAEMEKLMKAPGDRKSKRPQMTKLRDTYTAKMKKVFTKEQSAKYDEMLAKMRAQFRGGGAGGPGGMRPGGPGKGGPGGPPKG